MNFNHKSFLPLVLPSVALNCWYKKKSVGVCTFRCSSYVSRLWYCPLVSTEHAAEAYAMIWFIRHGKPCLFNTIISAKGIYRAALLTSIRNFADFKLSRICVLVNAFLDVFRNVITLNLRRCLRVSTLVIYFSKIPSVSLLTPCILRILTFLIRRPPPPRECRRHLPFSPSRNPSTGLLRAVCLANLR